jgi:hypothetical protein
MIDWHLAVRLGIHHATTKEGLEDSSNGDCKKAVGKFISKLITQSMRHCYTFLPTDNCPEAHFSII